MKLPAPAEISARLALAAALLLALIALPPIATASTWLLTANPLPDNEDLVLLSGHLELPDGEDPLEYLIVNAFEVASPDGDGHFEIHVRGRGPTVNAAARRDTPGQGNPWVGVTVLNETEAGEKTIRVGTKSSPALRINPRSTAKALVQANPLALGRDPHRAMLLEGILEEMVELDILEAAIRDHYASQPDFATVPEIRQAVAALMDALDRIFPHLPPPAVGHDGYTSETLTTMWDKASHLPVRFNSLDAMRQVEYRIGSADVHGSADRILIDAAELVPLDAVATMKRLSSDDLYRYTDEKGNSGRLNSLHQATRLRNLPGQHPIFDGEFADGEVQLAILPAKSLFRWLNVQQLARTALGEGAEYFFPGSTADGRLLFDPFEEGVYIIRVHNGKFFDGIRDTSGEGAVALDRFGDMTGFGLTINFTMAMMDVIDLLVGFRVDACDPLALFLPTFATELARQSWIAAESEPGLGFTSAIALVTLHLPVMLDNYTDCILRQPGTALLAFAKSILTLEQLTRRVSSVGSISDRLSALFSAPLGGVVGPMVAPMDTVLVIVGDPFSPAIETISFTDWKGAPTSRLIDEIDTATPPPGIPAEAEVTITGRRLIAEEHRPRQYDFVDVYGNRAGAEVTGSAVVGHANAEFPREQVTLRLPGQLIGRVSLSVSAGRGTTAKATPVFAEIVPVIHSVYPDEGFGYGQGYNQTVPNRAFVEGVGLDRVLHRIHLGDQEYFSNVRFRESPFLFLPALDQPHGLHEVRIHWRDGEEPVSADPPVLYRLYPPPVVESITPATVPPQGFATITGRNFGRQMDRDHGAIRVIFRRDDGSQAASTVPRRVRPLGYDGGDQLASLVVEVPQVSEETIFDVEVQTPRGTAGGLDITVAPEAAPPYSRTIRNFQVVGGERVVDEFAQTAIGWASQNPPPPGTATWVVECVPQSCPDPPELRTRVYLENLPETSPMHSSRGLVSNPPATPPFAGIGAEHCGPCDSGASSSSGTPGWPGVPDNWGDLTSAQIQDNVQLVGDIQGVYSGRHATIQAVTNTGRTEPVRMTGNGLVLDGARDVNITIRPTAINSSAALTIRNSQNITVTIDIHESATGSPDYGVLVQDSSGVEISGEIRRARTGIRILNSERVTARFLNIHTTGPGSIGVELDGGSMNEISQAVVRGGSLGIAENHVGFHIHGNTREAHLSGNAAFGLATGMLLEEATDSAILSGSIGNNIPALGNTPNGIGIHVAGGGARNTIRSVFFPANDIALLVEGGVENEYISLSFGPSASNAAPGDGNRVGMRLEGTGQPMERNRFWGLDFHWNRERHLEVVNATSPGFFRDLRLGIGYQPSAHPATFMSGLLIDGSEDVRFNNLEVISGNIGAIVLDSTRIRMEELEMRLQTDTGLRAERTSLLALERFQIDGTTSAQTPTEMRKGLHLIACSGLQIARGRVTEALEAGIDVEQPPADAMGTTRLLGRRPLPGSTAPPEDPPRETLHDPFRRPPTSDFSTQDSLQVRSRVGPALRIRDGAEDITIFGAFLSSFNGPSVILDDTGPNVSIISSHLFTQQSGTGEYPALLVQNNDAEGLEIGRPGLGNLITGSKGWGVDIRATRNLRLRSNFIGTSSGTFPTPNAQGGILVIDSGGIEIGGPDPDEGNLISGNGGPGVMFRGLGPGLPPLLQANFIGTDSGGLAAVANDGPGVVIMGPAEGTPSGGARLRENLISGNTGGGVLVEGITASEGATSIERNIIGRAFPFGVFGQFIGIEGSEGAAVTVHESTGVILSENRIGWHQEHGVALRGAERLHIQDNAIFSHGENGLDMGAATTGTTMVNNEISNNTGSGIFIHGLSGRNTVAGGEMHGNEEQAITLAANSNDNIPAPIVCDVATKELADGTRLLYTEGLAAPFIPDGARIELYVSGPDQQASRHLASTVLWEGRFFAYLGEIEPGAPVPNLAATVTDLKGNTSELGHHNPGHPGCIDPDWRRDGREDPTPPGVDGSQPAYAWTGTTVVMESEDALFLTTLTGDTPQHVNTGLDEGWRAHSPSIPRDAGAPPLLAFTATNGEGNDQVHLMLLDEPGPAVPATTEFTRSRHPRLSPDGTRLAFVSDDHGEPAVYLLDLSQDEWRRLSPAGQSTAWPDWSPAGNAIVYLDVTGPAAALRLATLGDEGDVIDDLPTDRLEGIPNRPAWGILPHQVAFELEPPSGPQRIAWLDIVSGETYLLPLLGEESHHEPAWATGRRGEPLLLHTVRRDNVPATIHLTDPYGYPLWQISPIGSEFDHTGPASGGIAK